MMRSSARWITAFTIAAAILRIPLLWRPMGADEATTFLYYASRPLMIGLTIYGSPNNHILHTVLMHLSFRTFGGAEWALRLPALLAGIALVPLTYFASRAMAQGGSLIAMALTAGAPVLIDYSTDGRGYTLLCCFVLLCVIALAKRSMALFTLSAALGFLTVPVMVYPFVMLVTWGMISRERKPVLLAAVAAIVLTAALYAPALIVSGFAAITSNSYVQPLPIAVFARDLLPYIVTAGAHLLVGIPLALQLLIAAGFIVAIVRRLVAPMWIGFAAVIILIGLQRVLPFPRVWLPLLPLIFITAAAAWPWPGKAEIAVAVAALITLTITGSVTTRLRETGELRAVREITRELRYRAAPGDPVLALPPSETPLAFYTSGHGVPVEVLWPDVRRPRLFVVENRDYGQSFARTMAFFRLDPHQFAIRRVRDFGSSALYELRRP